ncbi:MAG: zinc ribbon domain-containing protein [Myxococcota bacterium]|nr:zinc ribbon domain-containing protein [Myxococcota bacterium]
MSVTQEHVYMLWDCTNCGEEGIVCSPDARFCPQCGHVRTFEEFDNAYLPGSDATWDEHEHEAIPPEVVARLMSAGASWFCTNCTADNYGDEAHCHHCNAPRAASDEELRRITDAQTFLAYMNGDRGATADLVQAFGEYAGMRAAHGESFDMNALAGDQLEQAQQGRSAFRAEMEREQHHKARPAWDEADLPSSVESFARTHGEDAYNSSAIDGMRVQPISDAWRPAHAADDWSYDEEEEDEDEPWEDFRRARRKKFSIFAGIMTLVASLFGGVMYWGVQTKEYSGEITQLRWERHVYEERWTDVTLEDWRSSLSEQHEVRPVNGIGEQAGVDIISCTMRHHHYEDYVCGTEQVSCTHMENYTESYSCTTTESYSCGEECTTTRGSNGLATRTCVPKTCTRSVSSTCTETKQRPIHSSDTVDKICQRSIEASYCSYNTQVWSESGHHVLNGVKRPARWPEPHLDELERARREATYEVVISYIRGGSERLIEKDVELETFQQWRVGDEVIAVVTNFGTLRSIHPPGSRAPIE